MVSDIVKGGEQSFHRPNMIVVIRDSDDNEIVDRNYQPCSPDQYLAGEMPQYPAQLADLRRVFHQSMRCFALCKPKLSGHRQQYATVQRFGDLRPEFARDVLQLAIHLARPSPPRLPAPAARSLGGAGPALRNA